MPAIHQTKPNRLQVESFIERGYLKLEDAFSEALADAMRERLWSAMGLSPEMPSAWTEPVIRLPFMSGSQFVEAANTAKLHAAYDALVGEGRWLPPQGLGTFPVRFPSTKDAGDTGWHVDVSFGFEHPDFMQWRVNVKSTGRALLMLFLLSDVGVEDGPTRIRAGSHKQIARELLPHGEAGLSLAELAADGFAKTQACEEELATGAAGTVYLCHPFLVHAAQANRGSGPRFIAQPPLMLKHEFDPRLPPSPVQIAIREACGLGF